MIPKDVDAGIRALMLVAGQYGAAAFIRPDMARTVVAAIIKAVDEVRKKPDA